MVDSRQMKDMFWLNDRILRQANLKNRARGHKVENTISRRRSKRTTYSPYKEKTAMVQRILGKSDISRET